MSHDRFRELAAAALDFDLSESERQALAEHLATCSACRAFASGIRSDVDAARRWPAFDASPSLRLTVLGTGKTDAAGQRRGTDSAPWRMVVVAALLLLALVGVALGAGAILRRAPLPADVLPDGDWIAFSHQGVISLVRPDGTGRRDLPATMTGHASEPEWSPDGRRLAFVSNGEVVVLNAYGQLTNLTHDDVVELDPAWSHDGNWLAFATATGALDVAAADSTSRRTVVPPPTSDAFARWPSWSFDDGLIAYLGSIRIAPGQVQGTDAVAGLVAVRADGSSLTPVFMLQRGGSRPSWSPDGRLAFEGCYCKGVGHVMAYQADATALISGSTEAVPNGMPDSLGRLSFSALSPQDPVTGLGPTVYSPSFSPDGARVAAIDVDLARGGGRLVLLGSGGAVSPIAGAPSPLIVPHDQVSGDVPPVWASDGRHLAYATSGPGFAIVDVETGATLEVTMDNFDTVDGLDWRPVPPSAPRSPG